MDFKDKIVESLGGLENLTRKIPGYSGYKEKEMRREADRLLRAKIAGDFGAQVQRLVDMQGQLVAGGSLELLEQATALDDAVRRLQTFVDRIERAAMGYAGFFDAVKVKEEQLDALYEFDSNLLAQIDGVTAAVDAVQAAIDSGEGLAEAIAVAKRIAGDVNHLFNQREQVITGSL
ncbi:MAG: hypothetical protein ACOYZ7_12240 [Chloroflexota bacterium]